MLYWPAVQSPSRRTPGQVGKADNATFFVPSLTKGGDLTIATNNTQYCIMIDNYIPLYHNILSIATRPCLLRQKRLEKRLG